ncbi:MAG TPA: hypothetical protein VGM88_11845 [Kofleriaceae bacterium]
MCARVGQDALPAYRAALRDDDATVAAEAAYALAMYEPASVSRPQLHAWLASPIDSVRIDAVVSLAQLGDASIPLAPLLSDPLPVIRSAAVRLAAVRALAPDEVAALATLASQDDDDSLRRGAVAALAARAPDPAPLVAAALARGDVDGATASAIASRRLPVLPAVAAYLALHHDAAFYAPLVDLHAVCASAAIATDDSALALHALGALSGHADWSEAQLHAWAAQQPPCH